MRTWKPWFLTRYHEFFSDKHISIPYWTVCLFCIWTIPITTLTNWNQNCWDKTPKKIYTPQKESNIEIYEPPKCNVKNQMQKNKLKCMPLPPNRIRKPYTHSTPPKKEILSPAMDIEKWSSLFFWKSSQCLQQDNIIHSCESYSPYWSHRLHFLLHYFL